MPSTAETSDAPASTATSYDLGLNRTLTGTVAFSGDHDWYRINLTAGETYSFALVGTGTSATHLHDPYLRLRNAAGTEIASSDDDGPGLNSGLTFTATTSGSYYLDAAAFSTETGGYSLSAVAGSRAGYDVDMAAGALTRSDLSWSSPGTAASLTWAARNSFAASTDASGTAAPFSQLSAAQTAAVATGLQLFAEVAGLTFTQVNPGGTSDAATMLFSNYFSTTDGAGAYAQFPGSTASTAAAGDVRLNTNSISTTDLPQGNYSFFALIHEIGHALGLSHPGDYNAAPGQSIVYDTDAQFLSDSRQYTVMSYFEETNTGAGFAGYAETLMLYDITALQQLYGANMATRSGDTVYGFNATAGGVYDFTDNPDPALCIWDGGGADTLDLSGFGDTQVISLLEGSFSDIGGYSGNVSIAYGAVIENAIGGSGRDRIIGTETANALSGGGGKDSLLGDRGGDTLSGGGGRDILKGGGGQDILNGNGGNDRLFGQGGADTFVFQGAHIGNDRIKGFRNNTDTLQFDAALWSGTLTEQQVIDTYAHVSGGHTVFDFGGGDSVTLLGFGNPDLLVDDILIV